MALAIVGPNGREPVIRRFSFVVNHLTFMDNTRF